MPRSFSLQRATTSSYLSNQPVVPETTGTLFSITVSNIVKSGRWNAKVNSYIG